MLGLDNVACTSELCSWSASRTKAEPAPLMFIYFKRPKKEATFPSVPNDIGYELKGFSTNCSENDEDDELLKSLYEAAKDAGIFKSIK